MDFEADIRRVVGDAFTENEIRELLQVAYNDLELAVGTALAEAMSDDQFDEFEVFLNSEDEEGALRWLEKNRPDYKAVVEEQFHLLLGRLASIHA